MNTRGLGALAAIAIAAVFASAAAPDTQAQTRNGFDLAGSLIAADEILSGGPPKDAIPAIDRPQFVSAARATFLSDDDVVLALERNGVAKAYPLRILNWHEVVNDRFGDEAIVITYCPLCGSGVAFVSAVAGRVLSFGVSGLL
ncbi:MAG: DUF3179 domain-containing protein [Burkholderiaceae bacterium]|nr:DUF3179 domain-containing protein [Burkholderiaceae bacterium]